MSDWFVGFRPLIKSPSGATTRHVSLEAIVNVPVATVFTALTTRDAIDQVIDETVRFDARHGGKLRFVSQGDSGYGGTYSSIRVGKKVVILTEKHGELAFGLTPRSSGTTITLSASRLLTVNQAPEWEVSIQQVLDRLASYLREGP